jgi:nucleoside-diphosphate-sugar epimerase
VTGKFFVTGATGCIGGWVVKNLVESGAEVYALARSGSLQRLSLIMSEKDIAKVHVIRGDLTDARLVDSSVAKHGIDRIIHLAAMQLPLCRADPGLGARVNVEGTINVFEAAKKNDIELIVFSSSTAVYGTRHEYRDARIGHGARLLPHSLYGAYKQANECCAKTYFELDGISSIGIRPYVVYGPLRDQGMTSTPTSAMKAAVRREKYEISYGGRFDFQYADDTAKAFILAACAHYEGANTYNLGGQCVTMKDVVRAIGQAEPGAEDLITYVDTPLPFPPDADNSELEKITGPVCMTPLVDGVETSMEIFRRNASTQ